MIPCILTLNAGSSSIKFAIDRLGPSETRVASGSIERIGLPHGRFRGDDARGRQERAIDLPNYDAAMTVLLAWLSESPDAAPTAIGHRIVQGGPRLSAPQKLTLAVLEELRTLIPLAPNHLPGAIAAIEAATRAMPNLPQVLCFDTAFHRAMPEIAQRLPLPREFFDRGVRRYGFHGLSYEFIVSELRRLDGPRAGARTVVAHLGNGASLAAIDGGRPIDTTMGLTPLGGLVMGTRSGDLDPGVVLHLMREGSRTVDEVEEIISKQSGLLGVSGRNSDMKDLLDRESADGNAAEAIAMFVRQACKHISAMTAALGGMDTLVFTGGIGERSPVIRERIARGLAFLGVAIDVARNAQDAEVVSHDGSGVVVRRIATNEERIIARHTAAAL